MEIESKPTRHVWPWFVLAILVLGAVLAVLWVSAEARRLKERRQYYIPSGGTNAPAPVTNAPASPPR